MKQEHIIFGIIIAFAAIGLFNVISPVNTGNVIGTVDLLPACTDTDGGINVFQQGTMRGNFVATDYCSEDGPVDACRSRECKLIEFFCTRATTQKNERGTSQAYDCPPTAPVCDKGKCVSPSDAVTPYELK